MSPRSQNEENWSMFNRAISFYVWCLIDAPLANRNLKLSMVVYFTDIYKGWKLATFMIYGYIISSVIVAK